MYCSECGQQAASDAAKFCATCGHPVGQRTARSAPGDDNVVPIPTYAITAVPPASASAPMQRTSSGGNLMEYGRVDVTTVTFLSAITLGVYFFIWLYKAMKIYRSLSGRSGANLEQLFWGTVIAVGATVVLSVATVVLGLLALVAAIVIDAILLNEVLKDRDEIARRVHLISRMPAAGLLVTLCVLSNVFGATICGLIIGIPLAIVFYYQFFTGHNTLMNAAEQARLSPTPPTA